MEAVPVGAAGLQALDLRVHAVAELRPGEFLAAGQHGAEALVGGDLQSTGNGIIGMPE